MPPTKLLCGALLACLLLLNQSLAGEVSGHIESWSPEARYEVWRTTSLDLSDPQQPQARVVVDDPTGNFELSWPEDDQQSWIFLHQQVQPRGGPPLDLFRPAELLPGAEHSGKELTLHGVDPRLIWQRERLSTRPEVLQQTLLLAILVLGLGLLIRFGARSWAAPAGLRSAPLYELPTASAPSNREAAAVGALLLLTAMLRLPGAIHHSLDLLELSYLPGIGRPVLNTWAATGFAGLTDMLVEFSALYCLDLVHPPLYHLLLGGLTLFHEAEWLLRAPALLCSLATTWLLWRWLRAWSASAAVAAAGLHAVSPPAIYFGQDATPYALVALVGLASLMLLTRALRLGTSHAWWAWFAVIVLGFLCHYGLALVGIFQLTALGLIALLSTSPKRWRAAIHRASAPALLLAPIPLSWSWLHFSTFPTVGQDTRLIADTYAKDPGLLSFSWDFFRVTAGLDTNGPTLPAIAALVLLALGLGRALRLSPPGTPGGRFSEYVPGLLLMFLLVSFLLNVSLFYFNIREQLGGRIFYGFRWLSWFHPLMLGLLALGGMNSGAHKSVRVALSLIWISGLLPPSYSQMRSSPRPDYRAAAEFIRSELQDRDGIATLPAWFQRGNLGHYLKQGGIPPQRHSPDGPGTWKINGKRVNLEAIHSSLPFESSAANGHIDRLWVAWVRESMFGRDKFSAEVAKQAIAWADRTLSPDGVWDFPGLRLHRYQARPGGEVSLQDGALLVSAERAVLTHHSYPLLDDKPELLPGTELTGLPEGLGPTVRLHSPMAPSCVEWDWSELQAELEPGASHHWYLDLRIPFSGQSPPQLVKRGPVQLEAQSEGNSLRVQAVGPSCSSAPLQLLLLPAQP